LSAETVDEDDVAPTEHVLVPGTAIGAVRHVREVVVESDGPERWMRLGVVGGADPRVPYDHRILERRRRHGEAERIQLRLFVLVLVCGILVAAEAEIAGELR